LKSRLAALAALLLLAACATGERLSAAGDVHALLIAVRDDDRAGFDAHIDRPALEAQIQARIVDRAARGKGAARGLGVLLSGPLSRAAGNMVLRPDVFRAVAEYYGYKPGEPIPGVISLAQILRPLSDGRVCAARSRAGPCLLTFADEAGTWRLVDFGDPAMLRLR
jgi:hypothetical protein